MSAPQYKVFARHDASMRNGSFVKVYLPVIGLHKGFIIQYVNGDNMGEIAEVPVDHAKEYAIKEARAMSPVGI